MWLERVEPHLSDQGLDAASIRSYRQAWNEQMEKEAWPRWQTEATRFSNAVLEQMRTDYFDRFDVLDMFRWLRDEAVSDREKLRQVMTCTPVREEKPQYRSKEQGREM
jgi:hypothetical protein